MRQFRDTRAHEGRKNTGRTGVYDSYPYGPTYV